MKKLDDNIVKLLKEVVDHFDKEDRGVRERQILTWRQLKLLWEGFQRIYYSEVAHDWRIPTSQDSSGIDQSYYDKPVNVFRAYLESIIAALSIVVPPVTCYPDDADNPLDLLTARAGDKIAELVYRHNDIILVWLHGLFVYCTEGMVAAHTYSKDDEKYGTYEEKKYEDVEEEHEYVNCPDCGFEFSDRTVVPSNKLEGESPVEAEEDIPYDMMGGQELCPMCTAMVNPEIRRETLTETRLVGITKHPKSRQHVEVYGGLNVKVPNYARNQTECPYLIYSYETHYANAMEKYENYTKFERGMRDTYEGWGRLSPQYKGDYPENVVTCREVWLRPSAFNVLNEEDTKELKKLFKDGARVDLVNDDCVDYSSSSLDDSWTLTRNPLSDYIHHDPVGLLLTSIQEITNDLISLILQTIEHGIGQTFADPSFLDFELYRKTEVLPGGIFPTKPQSGRDIRQGFFELKTAALSPEILPFGQEIQQMGQLVSGALPSLFGGQLQGTGTASEYSMSRAQALQRLQNVWKMLTIWWKTIFGKVIPAYIKNVKDDERDVKKDQNGNYINVFIRKAELEGKIGRIELEANENLPLTWSQIKDVVMQLLQGANPQILQIIGSPENLPVIRKALGLTNFFVPGEDDRQKQYEEIKLLLNSEPIVGEDGQEMPSVEVDFDIDNHALEAQILRSWMISDAGRLAKTDNPAGYRNNLLHLKMHNFAMQQQMPTTEEETGEAPAEKPNELEKPAPIMEEEDVSATV